MSDRVLEVQSTTVSQAPELLCPDPLIVRLNMTFPWQQSSSHWPFYLSRAEPGRVYTKKEITENIFGDDRIRYKALNYITWLRSVYSLYVDRKYQEITIEGIGLFERANEAGNAYRITDDGLHLAQSYSADPSNDEWKRVFANILAKNDVRVRCVLLHLARWQSLLIFGDSLSTGAFFAENKPVALRAPDGTERPLFAVQQGQIPANSFTWLLQRDPSTILGPFLKARIECGGIKVPEQIRFESARNSHNPSKEPSVNKLRDHLKQALSLFRDIGVLVYVPHRQGWTLDRERCAAALEPAVVADLFGGAPESRFLDALRLAAGKLSDAEGLARIADLRDYLCDELDIPPGERVEYFNRQVAYYLRPDVGKLSIGRTFHAMAPPDDCLFGDLTQEYVEFIVAPA